MTTTDTTDTTARTEQAWRGVAADNIAGDQLT
jgi:hypothetical protein